MHLRGKDFRYSVTFPNGRSEVILSVPDYDFGWPIAYRLAEPRALPKGSTTPCLAHTRQLLGQPRAIVTWGEQTWDEMMIGFIDYYEDTRIAIVK